MSGCDVRHGWDDGAVGQTVAGRAESTHVGDCVPKRFMRVIACAFILLYAAQATASGDRGFLPLTNFERTRLVELPAGP